MGWNRTKGRGEVNPKYRTPEHRRYRAGLLATLRREGVLYCTAAHCLMPTREIRNPNGNQPDGLQAGHNDEGTEYVGAQHAKCNSTDGAKRGRARQEEAVTTTMRLTPGIRRP